MFTTATILFYASLLGFAGLFGYKQWQVNRGLATVRNEDMKRRSRMTLRLLRKIAVYWIKIGVQNTALFAYKHGLITTNWIKKHFYTKFPNAKKWFTLSEGSTENGPASFFLHNVAEYKMRIQKIKRGIKNKENSKGSEEVEKQ